MIHARRPVLVRTAWAIALLSMLAAPAHGKVLVGHTAHVRIESPHPSPPGAPGPLAAWTHTVHHPGATFLKLHFAGMTIGPGDVLKVLDGRGRAVAEYHSHAAGGARWVPAVDGDTITVELRATGPGSISRVVIDRYGYGTAMLSPRSICASDESQDMACFAGTAIEASGRAVGHMLVEANGAFFLCTGFLVSGESHFLSNEHCVSSQASVDSLEVRFNFQNVTCGGDVLAPFETFLGDRLIAANARFDFALMTLQGGPAATYGFLTLSPREPALGEALYVPQHPRGGPKKVSATDCRVSAVNIDGDAKESDFGHRCDTEAGSSGSPVLDAQHRVVGLHHWGGCTATGGHNQAVLMSKILPLLPLDVNFLAGRLECGSNGCLDIWKISCSSSRTRCVVARACAETAGTDRFALLLIGYSPAALIGQGATAAGLPGGCTTDVRLCRQTTGPLKVLMALSAPTPEAPGYLAFVGCEDPTGALGPPEHRTVKPATDQ